MSASEDIVIGPDERLKTMCKPIDKIDDSIRMLADRMFKDMYEANGVGLAAPQIGKLIQMIVIDVDYTGEPGSKNPYVLINPRIIVADGDMHEMQEGCLSFPGISCTVKRPSHVVVQALNLDGELMQYEARDNLLAVCLQHEIDHLNGTTMIDHLSPAERIEALRNLQEALAAGARPGDVEREEA